MTLISGDRLQSCRKWVVPEHVQVAAQRIQKTHALIFLVVYALVKGVVHCLLKAKSDQCIRHLVLQFMGGLQGVCVCPKQYLFWNRDAVQSVDAQNFLHDVGFFAHIHPIGRDLKFPAFGCFLLDLYLQKLQDPFHVLRWDLVAGQFLDPFGLDADLEVWEVLLSAVDHI